MKLRRGRAIYSEVFVLGAAIALGGGCTGTSGTVTDELGVDLGVDVGVPDTTVPDAVVPDMGPALGVVTTSPLNGTLNAACDTAVSAVFTEAVDPKTVTATTFTVSGSAGPVSGKVTAALKVVTFQPDSRLAPLVPHTVKLSTSIKTPDGRSLPKSMTWSFTCDQTWGKQATVASGSVAQYADPLAAIDNNGDAHVFWRPRQHPQDQIWYSAYDATSQKWSTPVLFRNKAGNYRVLRDFSGDVWLTWLERPQSTSTTVFARIYDHKSRSWHTATGTTLALPTTQYVASVAHDEGVTLALHANTSTTLTYSVHVVSYSRKTATWSSPDKVATARGINYLELGTDRTGSKVFAGWYRYDSSDLATSGLWVASHGVVSSGWTTGEHLGPYITAPMSEFKARLLMVDSKGTATVIVPNWDNVSRVFKGLVARTFDPSTGKWGVPVQITSQDAAVHFTVIDIHRETGRIVVVYKQYNSKGYDHTGAVRYDPVKKSWSAPAQITSKLVDSIEDLVVDSSGNGVLLYQPDSVTLSAYRLNGSTGLWGPTVNLYVGRVILPHIALGGRGEALAVWNSGYTVVYTRWFK
jgi:hypothetical protein